MFARAQAAYLYSSAVTLLAELQEGIAAHRPTIKATGRGGIQQTRWVDLLQEPVELVLAAAAEHLWRHGTRGAFKMP